VIINTYIMSVEVQEGPGNYDDDIQDQCVLITQAQPTEQRPPLSKLRKATTKNIWMHLTPWELLKQAQHY